jgi:molybdopterin molybdotransferase
MSLLPVATALETILADAAPLATETIAIGEADGRVLAIDLAAGHDQPPFPASAMDGYAVRLADVSALPATLTVIGEAAAGSGYHSPLGAGEAVRIFTGAPVPDGADAIVIQENTTRDGARVTVTDGAPEAGHIRRRGFDFSTGDTLVRAGTVLGPRTLTLAAAMGHGAVTVHKRPRVALIATGDELVTPDTPLARDQIVCSNPLGIAAILRRFGADVVDLGIARDTEVDLNACLDRAADADVVVTIGGASVGDHDLVGPVWRSRGADLSFWKVAMRPGKPLMYGRSGTRHIMGLPGNPVSSLVCTRVFLAPLIAKLGARGDTALVTQPARLTAPLEANGPRTHYMRATSQPGGGGLPDVAAVSSQDSSLLTRLADADVFIVREPGAPAAPAGTIVDTIALDF